MADLNSRCYIMARLILNFHCYKVIFERWRIFITHQHGCKARSTILFYQFRPSVRPSVQCRYCVWTNGHIVTVFRRSARGIILVFWAPQPLKKSNWNLFSWGVNYTGWEKFAIFDRNHRLSQKWYETVPRLHELWITNRNSWVANRFRSVSVPMILSESPWKAKGQIFTADLRNYARTFDLERLNLVQ